ncbi:MAG: alpha/beta hydrolase [Candidatus Sericytochromatia bacterium]
MSHKALLALLLGLTACQAPLRMPVNLQAQRTPVQTEQQMAGQSYRAYDEGHAYGTFHTYDALKACPEAKVRRVHVLLPRDYAQSGRRYPVVYMNDAFTAFFVNQHNPVGRTWDVAGTLSQLKGRVQDVIVVAMTPVVRDREYTLTAFADQRLCCQVEAYAREIAACIKPFFDQNYRTRPEREHTAMVGSSHGGLASFVIATRQSQTFGYAAALSPSFWAGLDYNYRDDDSKRIADSALVQPVAGILADPARRPTLWLDWGLKRDGGSINETTERLATRRTKEMAELLQTRYGYRPGRDLFVHEDPTGGHDEFAWKVRFGLLMQAFFPASGR